MNVKLKALVVAAVVTMATSNAANAITVGANGEMFLAVLDSTTGNSYIKALGTTALAFDGLTSSSPINLATTDTNWSSFAGTISNPATVVYQVLGFSVGAGTGLTSSVGSVMRTTSSAGAPTGLNSGLWDALNTDIGSAGGGLNAWMTQTGTGLGATGNGLVTGNGSAFLTPASTTGSSASVLKSNWDNLWGTGITTTSLLDANDGFYTVTRDPSTVRNSSGVPVHVSSLLGNWNLSSSGLLSYTSATVAAVPETNTWAMAMLGLGFMGFVARRRS